MAIDAASGWLLNAVEKNEPIPLASDIKNVVPDEYENGFVSIISIDLNEYSRKHGNRAVKKTLTIPAWLNSIAEEKNINFSQVLQSALINQLNLKEQP